MRPRNILIMPYLQAEAKGLFKIKFSKGALPMTGRACGGLKHHFDDLESLLSSQAEAPNIDQPREILREIHQYLEQNDRHILREGYNCMLNRLVRIYTQGLDHQNNRVYADTAVNYAGLIQAVSQHHVSYDYSEVIGQLLHYMNQLYKSREKGWLRIFKHLLGMSDSIQGIQILKHRHLNEIQQWIEEGVDNLFELRDDQIQLYSQKISELAQAEEAIEIKRRQMDADSRQQVLPITWLKEKAELNILKRKRDYLIDELESRQKLVDLLDKNMQEFEDILLSTRRSFLLHAV